jgi:hypothetical protein
MMTKIIAAYWDHEGFRQDGEIVEGILYRYWDVDPKTGASRRYGFVRLDDGTELFAHRNSRTHMDGYGVEKLRYIPSFKDTWPARIFEEPNIGERVVGIVGKDRQGRDCLVAWSYPSELNHALELCEGYLELERERIERDPKFRCMEIVKDSLGREFHQRRGPIFEGTKRQFEEWFPLGSYNQVAARFDPLLTQKIGDLDYIRWFEQETETDEWKRCVDPRKMRFQLTRTAAAKLLQFECRREIGTTGFPVWYKKGTCVMFALARLEEEDKQVIFFDSPAYLETKFESKVAENLWNIGAPAKVDEKPSAIPNANPYATSRRGYRKDAHDLTQLGRSVNEWEAVGDPLRRKD